MRKFDVRIFETLKLQLLSLRDIREKNSWLLKWEYLAAYFNWHVEKKHWCVSAEDIELTAFFRCLLSKIKLLISNNSFLIIRLVLSGLSGLGLSGLYSIWLSSTPSWNSEIKNSIRASCEIQAKKCQPVLGRECGSRVRGKATVKLSSLTDFGWAE